MTRFLFLLYLILILLLSSCGGVREKTPEKPITKEESVSVQKIV